MRQSMRALFRSPPGTLAISPHARVPRHKVSSRGRTIAPEGPSCSRWLSCSHCRQSKRSTGGYFSPAPLNSGKRPDILETEDDSGSVATTVIENKARRLPLPPPLPYSPESIPFKRHLELLKFSLSSSPDESWTTYHSLHPSLQRHVPNELYLALIHHQLQDEEAGYGRVKELVIFAQECGMGLSELGLPILREIIERSGNFTGDHKQRRSSRHISRLQPEAELLHQTWDALVAVYGGRVDRIPEDVIVARLTWLQAYVRSTSDEDKVRSTGLALDIIEAVVPYRSGSRAAGFADWFFLARFPYQHYRIENVKSMAFLISHGVVFPHMTVRRVLRRTRIGMFAKGASDDHEWKRYLANARLFATGPRVKELLTAFETAITHIQNHAAVSKFGHPPIPRGSRLLTEPQADIPNIIRHCLELLGRIKKTGASARGSTTVSPSVSQAEDMSQALDLFERVAHQPLSDVHVLVTETIATMKVLRDTNDPAFTPSLIRFVKCLFSAKLMEHIDSHLLHMLFDLITYSMSESNEAFHLMRRVYIESRASSDPYRWYIEKKNVREKWARVVRLSISPEHRQIHFASRLYHDYLADGGWPGAGTLLSFINFVGSYPERSKYPILERLIRDYLHDRPEILPDRQGRLVDVVKVLVSGLTARKRPRDAWLAFHLSRRILADVESTLTPPIAFELPLDVLARSPRTVDNRRAVEILDYVAADDDRAAGYYAIVFRGLTQMGPRYLSNKGRHHVIAVVKEVYDQMASKQIPVNIVHVDSVVRVFLRAGHIDRAIKTLLGAAKQKRSVFAKTVATTMRYLARQKRFAEAFDLYNACRQALFSDEGRDLLLAKAIVLLVRGQDSAQLLQEEFGSKILKSAQELVRLGEAAQVKEGERSSSIPSPTDPLIWASLRSTSSEVAAGDANQNERDPTDVDEIDIEDYEIERVVESSKEGGVFARGGGM